ncbi:MAG: hypothetical protein B6D63_02775 [Candidatus Latescibacteria bacterium 4484_7]|nr:MAG: hypothetical protein B6D63_02775 [Candidatus Latescibacteria bacterium 4484_7]RKZ08639.1 MAG: hypothetical protein DRQ05_01100 [bacterium]
MGKKVRSFERIFKSLGNPVRLHILKEISQEPICVSNIAKRLKISNPLTSHHIKILERENLVIRTKEGVYVRYVLNKEGFDALVVNFYKYLGIEMEIENIPKFLRTIKGIEDFLTKQPKLK